MCAMAMCAMAMCAGSVCIGMPSAVADDIKFDLRANIHGLYTSNATSGTDETPDDVYSLPDLRVTATKKISRRNIVALVIGAKHKVYDAISNLNTEQLFASVVFTTKIGKTRTRIIYSPKLN